VTSELTVTTTPPTADWPLRSRVDLPAAEQAAAAFLTALGMRLDTETTARTAARMARAYADLVVSRDFEPTTFPNEECHHDIVIARSVPFGSICAHHLLPFVGAAHVGYLPGDRIIGLSKLARLVEFFAARPQVQEDMTQQIAAWLAAKTAAAGVGVVVTAEHLCMTLRGAQAHGATTVTTAWRGVLSEDRQARGEFLALAAGPAGCGRSGR
jgi:GTP cyclohydrolase IA